MDLFYNRLLLFELDLCYLSWICAIWAGSVLYAGFISSSLFVRIISALDPDRWRRCRPSGPVWGGVWSVMSEMQLLWGPQTTDWALNSYMRQSRSVCEQSCCFGFLLLHVFITNLQLRWPFQQWKKNIPLFMQSDVYICFECVRQLFPLIQSHA